LQAGYEQSVVLRFCIPPLHGAIVLLAIMDISARAISLAENGFRTLFPESFGAEVGWRIAMATVAIAWRPVAAYTYISKNMEGKLCG
jgi:hypothetical protein